MIASIRMENFLIGFENFSIACKGEAIIILNVTYAKNLLIHMDLFKKLSKLVHRKNCPLRAVSSKNQQTEMEER